MLELRLRLYVFLMVGILMPNTALATFSIDWTNKAGSGFNNTEKAVMDAAIAWWEMVITDLDGNGATADTISITITETPETGVGSAVGTENAISMLPQSGVIKIDDGTNANFFVDPNPHSNEEFERLGGGAPGHYAVAKAGSAAAGKIDMLSVIKHELGHILGFSVGYTKWNNNIAAGVLTYDAGPPPKTIALGPGGPANSHLNCPAAPLDLMCSAGFAVPGGNPTGGGFGDRRVQSQLDLDILAGVYGYTIDSSALKEIPEPSTFALVVLGLGLLTRRKTLP